MKDDKQVTETVSEYITINNVPILAKEKTTVKVIPPDLSALKIIDEYMKIDKETNV